MLKKILIIMMVSIVTLFYSGTTWASEIPTQKSEQFLSFEIKNNFESKSNQTFSVLSDDTTSSHWNWAWSFLVPGAGQALLGEVQRGEWILGISGFLYFALKLSTYDSSSLWLSVTLFGALALLYVWQILDALSISQLKYVKGYSTQSVQYYNSTPIFRFKVMSF